MQVNGKTYFEGLEDKLMVLPFALTISDTSEEDHPLIFANNAFYDLTGYGPEVLGQNCRFLQSDLENGEARAEIRHALSNCMRTQVLLRNRRKNGEPFYNLLSLETVHTHKGFSGLAVGSQFDLGAEAPGPSPGRKKGISLESVLDASDQAQKLRIERRRLLTDAAVRLVQSWCIIQERIDAPKSQS